MGCGVTFAKVVLVVFNVFFLLFGGVLFAIGIVAIVRPELSESVEALQTVKDVDTRRLVQVAAYILIAVGAFMMLVSICGILGAIKANQCLLGIFITFILLVMAAEITITTITLVFQDEMEDWVEHQGEEFMGEYLFNRSYSAEATLLNAAQRYFKCCGINASADFNDIHDATTRGLFCYSNDNSSHVPATCFEIKKSTDDDKDTKSLACNDVETNKLHRNGCKVFLQDFVEKWAIVFVALTLGFVCLEIFGLVFAICLCRIGGKGE